MLTLRIVCRLDSEKMQAERLQLGSDSSESLHSRLSFAGIVWHSG